MYSCSEGGSEAKDPLPIIPLFARNYLARNTAYRQSRHLFATTRDLLI